VKRKRVFPRSALYIFLRSHVTPSVPVRGGRHVVQICRSLRESSTDARPTGDGKARAVRRGCKSARVRQWPTRIEREGSPPSCQIDSPSYFTTSGIGSHGAYASESLFSRRPHGRLGLAQEETPSVVSEEVANDSSSKPIRVFTKYTPFFFSLPSALVNNNSTMSQDPYPVPWLSGLCPSTITVTVPLECSSKYGNKYRILLCGSG
jgi:hypothetical protein